MDKQMNEVQSENMRNKYENLISFLVGCIRNTANVEKVYRFTEAVYHDETQNEGPGG